ncbi:DUF6434 domain-containing protein [Ulvibacterium sp.]|uniref:DUF6434 domain-containing protein n=1 Tax=Ulvibacterium sp. TaxID=2665914 RepID=UPI003CC5AC8F
MPRPDFSEITSGKEFNRWYWLKEELVEICKQARIPYTGRKFELQDRIIFMLDYPGKPLPPIKKEKASSNFNWSKAKLDLDTKITDSISFGPNFRNFMKSEIGPKFSCHSDFMDWVKSNPGKTLEEAILMWYALEDRKKDPNFKRAIAKNNMMAQYVRDFLKDNADQTLKDALYFWKLKKQRPTETRYIVYEKTDVELS